jgi:hypothetical protein
MRSPIVLMFLALGSCASNPSGVNTDTSGVNTDTSGVNTDTSGVNTDTSGVNTDTSSAATGSSGTATTDVDPTTGETGAEDCDQGADSEIVVLASNVLEPTRIALDETHVWWVGQPGYMMKCAKDGCADTPTTILTDQPGPVDLIVDSGKVYWSLSANSGLCSSDGFVMQCDADACEATATLLVQSVCSRGLAVDATNVYVAEHSGDAGTVERCARSGCAGNSDELAEVLGGPTSLALRGSTLVWTAGPTNPADGGAVFVCDPLDCVPQALASGPSILPVSVATDGLRAYWPNGDGSIMACALTGCDNLPQVLATGQDSPYAIATNGVDVVWGTAPMGPGGVYKIAVDGSEAAPTTVATGAMVFTPGSVAIDAHHIYWSDLNTNLIARARNCR